MRLYSTPESVDNGEISLLAIVETILAIAITIGLSVWFGTRALLAVGVCLAPFLLLRTDHSIRLGVRLMDKLNDRFAQIVTRFRLLWLLILFTPLFPVVVLTFALFSKVTATLLSVCMHPIASVSAVPKNWFNVALCTDLCRPPEVLPGYDRLGQDKDVSFSAACRKLFVDPRQNGEPTQVLLFLIGLIFLPCLFGPALIYRWSLKSTSLVYTPLLWLVWTATRKYENVGAKLQNISEKDLGKAVTWYSLAVAFAFIAKYMFLMSVPAFADWWNQNEFLQFLAIYVAPAEIPIWQWSAAINACLALGLFLYAKLVVRHQRVPDKVSDIVVRIIETIRVALTLYTVACTLYITLEAVDQLTLPKLGTKLFPWS